MPSQPTAVVDSLKNPRVLRARALQTRKGRRTDSAFLVEGPHAVSEVVRAPGFDVREVFITATAAQREPDLFRTLAAADVAVVIVTDRVIAALGETVTPQGVVAVVGQPAEPPMAALPPAPRLVVVLDRCADPGNAGTVIRTADAAGADAVVLGAGSVDVWSGKCVRASAGSVFHLPVIAAGMTEDAVRLLGARGCQVLATAADGAVDLDEVVDSGRLAAPTAWLFGNEAHGLSPELRESADITVRIPIHGRAESLNLAASVAICLYASARVQHGDPPSRTEPQ
jgi:TrmH family RNA methyltransferase